MGAVTEYPPSYTCSSTTSCVVHVCVHMRIDLLYGAPNIFAQSRSYINGLLYFYKYRIIIIIHLCIMHADYISCKKHTRYVCIYTCINIEKKKTLYLMNHSVDMQKELRLTGYCTSTNIH